MVVPAAGNNFIMSSSGFCYAAYQYDGVFIIIVISEYVGMTARSLKLFSRITNRGSDLLHVIQP